MKNFNYLVFFDSERKRILDELIKADKADLQSFTIEAISMESKNIGLILHDISDEPKIQHIWKFESYVDRLATFIQIKDNYWDVYNTYISQDEFHNMVNEKGMGLLRNGCYGIDGQGNYCHVLDISIKKHENQNVWNHVINPNNYKVYSDYINIEYENEYGSSKGRIKNGKFPQKMSASIDEFLKGYVLMEESSIDLLEAKIKRIEIDGDLSSIGQLALSGTAEILQDETNAITLFNSKDQLDKLNNGIAKRKNKAEVYTRSLNRVLILKREELELIMQSKKDELSLALSQLNQTIAVFKQQMERIEKLIITLELYLGVNEHIVQIAQGEPASINDPINLRQSMLYMDEEFGDPENGGLDHKDIKEFEDWMISTRAFEKIAPEKKCVVILRPRRRMKERSSELHPIIKAKLEQLDKMVYIFFRNGDNIYRIWTDHIDFMDRLFPLRTELTAMMNELFEHQNKMNNIDPDSYEYRKALELYNKSESHLFYYKRVMIMIQGIITRTQIFAPIPAEFNLLDPSTHEGVIKYVYDDEMLLPDGRMRFNEWLININKNIIKGSRIIIGRVPFSAHDSKERFALQWEHDHSAPQMPQAGEYTVFEHTKDIQYYFKEWIPTKEYEKDHDKDDKDKLYGRRTGYSKDGKTEVYVKGNYFGRKMEVRKQKVLRISYNPKDTVYGSWGGYSHERKTNITMEIYPETDSFLINYDSCSLDDIEFYLNNRIDRVNYLQIMPILWTLKKRLKEESQQEEAFINMLVGEISSKYSNINFDNIKQIVMESINWWKNEIVTVWKRPISNNDIKARTMIKDKVLSHFKKLHGIDINLTNDKRILVYISNAFTFLQYGSTKADFISHIIDWKQNRYIDADVSKSKITKNTSALDNHVLINKTKPEFLVLRTNEVIYSKDI